MSDFPSRSSRKPRRPAGAERSSPQDALDLLLADTAANPVRRALWLDALDRRLHPLLPQPLAAHARLANVDGHRLVYLVDSPIWHARLRLASEGLLDAARSVGLDVREVVVRTAPRSPVSPPSTTPALRPKMSAAASEALRTALASLKAPDPGGSPDRDGS